MKKLHLKNTIFSKRYFMIILCMIVQYIAIITRQKNVYFTEDFEHTYISLLFEYLIIIGEYLATLHIYMSHKNYMTLIRYENKSDFKRELFIDISILTILFVFIFNVIIICFMFNEYGNLLPYLDYFIWTFILQLLFLSLVGYIYLLIYSQTFSVKIAIAITFVICALRNKLDSMNYIKYMLTIQDTPDDIMSSFKIILSLNILMIIILINTNSKRVESYEKK